MQAAQIVCTLILSEMLAFDLKTDSMQECLSHLLPGGHGVRDFHQECQIWTILTIEHFSTLKKSNLNQIKLNQPWPTGHDGTPGHVHIWLPFCMIQL